jgi:hypothetical protein
VDELYNLLTSIPRGTADWLGSQLPGGHWPRMPWEFPQEAPPPSRMTAPMPDFYLGRYVKGRYVTMPNAAIQQQGRMDQALSKALNDPGLASIRRQAGVPVDAPSVVSAPPSMPNARHSQRSYAPYVFESPPAQPDLFPRNYPMEALVEAALGDPVRRGHIMRQLHPPQFEDPLLRALRLQP